MVDTSLGATARARAAGNGLASDGVVAFGQRFWAVRKTGGKGRADEAGAIEYREDRDTVFNDRNQEILRLLERKRLVSAFVPGTTLALLGLLANQYVCNYGPSVQT